MTGRSVGNNTHQMTACLFEVLPCLADFEPDQPDQLFVSQVIALSYLEFVHMLDQRRLDDRLKEREFILIIYANYAIAHFCSNGSGGLISTLLQSVEYNGAELKLRHVLAAASTLYIWPEGVTTSGS